MKIRNSIAALTALALLLACLCAATGCAVQGGARDLTKDVAQSPCTKKEPDDVFINGTADFSFRLFQRTYHDGQNTLISPLSVLLALAMTANGTKGETLEQMEKTLCDGYTIAELNACLYTYLQTLPSDHGARLSVANSLWLREGAVTANDRFLQTCKSYYGAPVFSSDFGKETPQQINRWVRKNTDGVIDKLIDEISPDTVMYLINTVLFDAEWKTVYQKSDIRDATFTTAGGEKKTVSMMYSDESRYLKDENAKGFLKPYKNGYSLVTLLPDADISLSDYIAGLSGERFLGLLGNAQDVCVSSALPKFDYAYGAELSAVLRDMGMTLPFEGSADFSAIGDAQFPLRINQVIHKTRISVDAKGTKAGAATAVSVDKSAAMTDYTVRLDRPFLYAIIDNNTNLPLFIGAVTDIGQ